MNQGVAEIIAQLEAERLTPDEAAVAALLGAGPEDTARLYAAADRVRQAQVGDVVHLRGIIEFSNHCRKSCAYCGIRGPNRSVARYRMTPDEIVATAGEAARLGYGTVVLQSGEDVWFTCARVCALVGRVKAETGLAVTLSIGVRPAEELRAFHAAGCDRYLLRFETADRAVFARLHPDEDYDLRMQCLADIRAAGIQVGSGFMIGLPFAGLQTLAADILWATRLDLDMIGCGPYLAHPDTPLAGQSLLEDREVYFRTLALLRLLNPRAHIPATTAFDALCAGGRDLVLARGGNVFMPNVTPARYRKLYQLYPNKPCVDEDGATCGACVAGRIARLGRTIGKGPGHSVRSVAMTET